MTDFIDSNVLVYLFDAAGRKRDIADGIVNEALQEGGAISFQVVQEVLNTMTRRDYIPSAEPDMLRTVRDLLLPLWTINPSEELYSRAISVHDRYRYSFYDSLIIAAALQAACTRLYSEDMQDGQRIEGLTIVNPFA
jgi:predicted nucleic acid-binding protein